MRLFYFLKREVVEKESQFSLTYLVFIDKGVFQKKEKIHLVKNKRPRNIRTAERRTA